MMGQRKQCLDGEHIIEREGERERERKIALTSVDPAEIKFGFNPEWPINYYQISLSH